MVYPIKNRRDSLQIDYFYLKRQIGAYLEYGYNDAEWDDEKKEVVEDIIKDGLHQYYFPPPLQAPYAIGMQEVHRWSFLQPEYRFDTASGQREYSLPDNFDFPLGDLAYVDVSGPSYSPLRRMSPMKLRNLEYEETFTSTPRIFAIRSDQSDGDAPQRQVLILHPTPDGAYELKMQYQAEARKITSDHPYPLGGQTHGRGILASCLAIAELRKVGAKAAQYANFMETLAANIIRDRERGADFLGYNGNMMTEEYGRGSIREMDGIFYQDGTYNGTLYSG